LCGQAEWRAGTLDILLGAADPLRHGCFRNHKRMGNLCGGEATHGPERESDGRGLAQSRVAAHKQEKESIFGIHIRLDFFRWPNRRLFLCSKSGLPLAACHLAANTAGCARPCRRSARSAELLRLAYVLTADQHAAEDLLQNSLIKAAAHWGRIHSSPEAYVRRIMYREQVSQWRWRARRPETAMA